MNKRKEILMWQVVAVGIAMFAVFKYRQYLKEGGSTINGMNINVSSDKFVDMASKFVPREWRHQAQQLGRALVARME